jgi:hypothetical protein
MKKGADHSIFLKSHKVSQKRFEIFASNATRGAQKTIGNFLKNAKYAPPPVSENCIAPQYTHLWGVTIF